MTEKLAFGAQSRSMRQDQRDLIWQNFAVLKVDLVFSQFLNLLLQFLQDWANNCRCKWPNIGRTIWPSGHTGQDIDGRLD